jgi:hypothetical protein
MVVRLNDQRFLSRLIALQDDADVACRGDLRGANGRSDSGNRGGDLLRRRHGRSGPAVAWPEQEPVRISRRAALMLKRLFNDRPD